MDRDGDVDFLGCMLRAFARKLMTGKVVSYEKLNCEKAVMNLSPQQMNTLVKFADRYFVK